MEQNTLLHGSQLCIAVINITLYYNDYGPAYTDTVGWLSVATNTMTHRLRTSMDGPSFQFDQCLSLNFDYNDDQLRVPQVSMTPDSNTKLNFDSPSGCIFVIIGGKYLRMIGFMDTCGTES